MRYDLPIPYGWYCVQLSRDLNPGDVKPLRYFGEDLVLFRTEAGEAVLLDAYCPHLGAHLGWGGKVCGESITCPFHAWQFNGRGVCTGIPYASRIPPKVADQPVIRRYPVNECNGLIWAWYHPRAIDPLFEVEHVPELDSDDWSDYDVYDWEINTVIQETGENAVDKAHFLYVHTATSMPEGRISVEGHCRITDVTMMSQGMDPATGAMLEDEDKQIQGHLITKNIGPGQTIQHFDTFYRTLMIGTLTPIDDQHVHMRFCFSQPHAASPEQLAVAQGVVANVVDQVGQDIPIWEHKKYQDHPLLCDGDGPINQYRQWFRQFYDDVPIARSDCA